MTESLPLPVVSLNGYQALAKNTAIYPGQGTVFGLNYVTLKLAGEAGEFAENFGKAIRDDELFKVHTNGIHTSTCYGYPLMPERREKMKKELGDILWYVANAAGELGYSLSEIASDNLTKLASRKERNQLHGSGDDR